MAPITMPWRFAVLKKLSAYNKTISTYLKILIEVVYLGFFNLYLAPRSSYSLISLLSSFIMTLNAREADACQDENIEILD
jgi:hypothetical protein